MLLALALSGCPKTGPLWPGLPQLKDGATYIWVFDIGQADAMLVVNDGKSMLIDAGATATKQARQNFRDIPKFLERTVGKRHLDYFVVSHYHQDHIGFQGRGARGSYGNLGLWGLVLDEGVYIDTVVDRGFMVIGKKGNTQKNYERAMRDWLRKGLIGRRMRVRRKDMIDMGKGLKVEIVSANGAPRMMQIRKHNPRLLKNFPPSENDFSIEMKFTRGDFEMITGGDLSGRDVTRAFGPMRTSYNDIESAIAGDIGDVEVYRVHHHGSNNSSNPCFIKVLHPEVSIFSSGMNGYGHPDLRVVNALKKMGQVYITSGASKKVYNTVKPYIVEGHVGIVVEPKGKHYWVNGRKFRSYSEAKERDRPGYLAGCRPGDARKRNPDEADETGKIEPD